MLEARKIELQSRLDAPEVPELLHPRMADVYREKAQNLCRALENENSRTVGPNKAGCGGVQPPVLAAVEWRGVT